jgi:maltose alpha-D-glucosyltransferase / alpha-amylase
VRRNFQLLARSMDLVGEEDRAMAQHVLAAEKEIIVSLQQITGHRIQTRKCRIHGDLHLGQALFTGKDFVFIDFEGEPARTLNERRLKRSPLRDVAGMIRSFHYAAVSSLLNHGVNHPGDIPFLEPWMDAWYVFVSGIYLQSYLKTVGESGLVPRERLDLGTLLRALLLEKAVYELGYELNNRPEWLAVPLRGIEMILRENH